MFALELVIDASYPAIQRRSAVNSKNGQDLLCCYDGVVGF
jgi:hypothetical protein